MSGLDIPLDIERSEISSLLNSVVLLMFLMGMYIVIYLGTIYVYFTKNHSRYHPVPAAITILFLSGIAQTAVQWYDLKWQFVDNGDTRQSVFLAATASPPWSLIALNISNCVTFVIADGLLIWRCFHVWDRSLRVIALSLLLIVAEIALFLVQIVFQTKFVNTTISVAFAARLNALFSAAFFMSFGTTLVTTVLITYRIYSVSKHDGASSRRFKHIIDIVVQSGAVYALAQLAPAIAGLVPGSGNMLNARNVAFEAYAQMLDFSIAGISSTVMVARVALLSEDTTYPSTSVHLSGLQFHARSTQPTVNIEAMEVTHSIDGGLILVAEGEEIEGKAE